MAHEDYLGLRGFRTTICGAFSAIQRGEALSKGQAWKDRAAICLAIGAVVGVYGLVEGLGGWQASLGQVSFLRTAAAGNREQPILRPHLNPPLIRISERPSDRRTWRATPGQMQRGNLPRPKSVRRGAMHRDRGREPRKEGCAGCVKGRPRGFPLITRQSPTLSALGRVQWQKHPLSMPPGPSARQTRSFCGLREMTA